MVEVSFTYDLHPNIDEEAYKNLARRVTLMMVKAEGFIELRANRNLLGSPHVRRTSVWKSLAHWAAFAEEEDFQKLTHEFRKYVTHIDVNLWGKSPYVPESIRPE